MNDRDLVSAMLLGSEADMQRAADEMNRKHFEMFKEIANKILADYRASQAEAREAKRDAQRRDAEFRALVERWGG